MSDIRVRNGIVFAAPIWAYKAEPWRYNGTDQYSPIREMWQPILDALDGQADEVKAQLEVDFQDTARQATIKPSRKKSGKKPWKS